MSMGNAKAHEYVIHELIRRTKGRQLLRNIEGSDAIGVYADDRSPAAATAYNAGVRNLVNWHNNKTPFVRLVSNAVPRSVKGDADKHSEYPDYRHKQTVFGLHGNADDLFKDSLRFNHVLYGGTGFFNPDNANDGANPTVDLGHSFTDMYEDPWNMGTYADEKATDNPEKVRMGSFTGNHRSWRPAAGITNVDITYKGTMGALKKAIVSFKCHSIDDLERLEALYMYPGIKLLLEWGWSQNTNNANGEYNHQDINLVPLDDNILKSPALVHTRIQENRHSSGGCYDGMFGSIVNFNWSINSDLSFNCQTHITDIGDSIFTVNVNTSNTDISKDAVEGEESEASKKNQLLGQIKLMAKKCKSKRSKIDDKPTTIDYDGGDQVGTFPIKAFSAKIGNSSKADDHKSRQSNYFVRFGDITDELLNRLFCITTKAERDEEGDEAIKPTPTSKFCIGGTKKMMETGLTEADPETMANPEIAGTDTEPLVTTEAVKQMVKQPVSIISNDPHLLSCNPGICLLPNQLGKDPNKCKDRRVPTKCKGEGCDFKVPGDKAKKYAHNATSDLEDAGFLANIMVNLDFLEEVAEDATTVNDFLSDITRGINEVCGSIWSFQWRILDEYPGFVTCIDTNFSWTGKIEPVQLPLDNMSGLVRTLSMKSKISSNMVNALYIAANTPLTGKKVKKGELASKNIIPLDIDFSIDGISGIQFGTIFSIDYLPARYRTQSYLFAKQVQHSIDPSGWNTTVTAGFRWAPDEGSMDVIDLSLIGRDDDGYYLLNKTEKDIIPIIQHKAGHGTLSHQLESQSSSKDNLLPKTLFESLDSRGLTIGLLPDGTGKPVKTAAESKPSWETLLDRLGYYMDHIYRKNKNSDEVKEAIDFLKQILFFTFDGSEREYEAPPKGSSKAGNSKPTTKKVTDKKANPNTDVTKVGGYVLQGTPEDFARTWQRQRSDSTETQLNPNVPTEFQ